MILLSTFWPTCRQFSSQYDDMPINFVGFVKLWGLKNSPSHLGSSHHFTMSAEMFRLGRNQIRKEEQSDIIILTSVSYY